MPERLDEAGVAADRTTIQRGVGPRETRVELAGRQQRLPAFTLNSSRAAIVKVTKPSPPFKRPDRRPITSQVAGGSLPDRRRPPLTGGNNGNGRIV